MGADNTFGETNFNPKMSSEMDICHGCGNTYRDCVCEELDAEMNEGKYPDCDPNDGYYAAPKYIDEIKLKAKVMKQSSSEHLEEKPFLTEEELNRIFGGLEAFIGDTEIYCFYKSIIKNVIDEKLQQSNEKISSLKNIVQAARQTKEIECAHLNGIISSLESELKEAKKSVQLLHEDMINAEKRGQEKAESEIKALREERDKFAIEFLEYMWRNNPIAKKGTTAKSFLEQFKAYTLNTEKHG